MPKHILDALARQEIHSALFGLKGAQATHEINRLAEFYGCSVSQIYQASKAVRPPRKPRSDKGRRRADILAHPGLLFATEKVVTQKLDPDLALEYAEANGHDVPVSLGTFQRYLREKGLNRRALRHGRRPYRNFEAREPGEIFQVDFSGLKSRWVDLKTRRIFHLTELDVSKNHPNTVPTRRELWRFALRDDYSRFLYIRFVDCLHPNSSYVIGYLLECFRALGVPRKIYADNDSILRSARIKRAASILDRAFVSSGGFVIEQHGAGNAQATGKAEIAHQLSEKYEKLIGSAEEQFKLQGVPLTLDVLNAFAADFCERYNWRVCRATGEKPAVRLRNTTKSLRIPPPAVLDSAFKAVEHEHKIAGNLVVSFDGVKYQLPRSAQYPFRNLVGHTITCVWLPEEDFFIAVVDGTEYEIERRAWQPDVAGEYKSVADSEQQKALKHVRASVKARRRAHKEAGTHEIVPGFQVPLKKAKDADRTLVMPQGKDEVSAEALAALGPGIVPPSLSTGRLLKYWDALTHFLNEELLTTSAADKAWLRLIYRGRAEVSEDELRGEIAARTPQPQPTVIELQRRA